MNTTTKSENKYHAQPFFLLKNKKKIKEMLQRIHSCILFNTYIYTILFMGPQNQLDAINICLFLFNL